MKSMRERIKEFSKREPLTLSEWNDYFHSLAYLIGFDEMIEESSYYDRVYVQAQPNRNDRHLGKFIVGEAFIHKYEDLRKHNPELFKKILEHTLVQASGNGFFPGIIGSDMQAMATMMGAEKLGYSKEEILELLAIGIVVDYLAEKRINNVHLAFEVYIEGAEKEYDNIFWDFLFKEDVTELIKLAKQIYEDVSNASGGSEKEKTEKTRIIDGHVHLGNNFQYKFYTIDKLEKDLAEANAQGAVIFPFPEDMYRIVDSTASRMEANRYVLETSRKMPGIYPFYFVWNDYILPDNLCEYKGIKWHRHYDEPEYDYNNSKFKSFVEKVKSLNLPVILEEEFLITIRFVEKNPELNIIIPHVGKCNGGYEKMDVFFDNEKICFDTSTAPIEEIERIIKYCGPERVIFGSDVSGTSHPFYNFPIVELDKLSILNLSDGDKKMIYAQNIERLMNNS